MKFFKALFAKWQNRTRSYSMNQYYRMRDREEDNLHKVMHERQ